MSPGALTCSYLLLSLLLLHKDCSEAGLEDMIYVPTPYLPILIGVVDVALTCRHAPHDLIIQHVV